MADIFAYTASDLGATIRRERKALGLTQQEVARRAGITRQTVIDLEQGKNTSIYVLMGVLAALGKALQVKDARPSVTDVRELFEEEEEDGDDEGEAPALSVRPRHGRGRQDAGIEAGT